jgi:hypothetical protein
MKSLAADCSATGDEDLRRISLDRLHAHVEPLRVQPLGDAKKDVLQPARPCEQPAAGADDVHWRVQRTRNQTQTFLERVSRSAVTLPPFVVDGLCNADLRHPFLCLLRAAPGLDSAPTSGKPTPRRPQPASNHQQTRHSDVPPEEPHPICLTRGDSNL